jgi:tryptophan-rich hypothetical protein
VVVKRAPESVSKQLLLSKWTSLLPREKEKHFVVRRVFAKRSGESTTTFVEIEAVMTKQTQTIPLQELGDASLWLRGWCRDRETG